MRQSLVRQPLSLAATAAKPGQPIPLHVSGSRSRHRPHLGRGRTGVGFRKSGERNKR